MKPSKTTVMTMVYLVQYLSDIYDMRREHIEHTIPQLDIYWLLNSNCHNYYACIFSGSLLECLKHSKVINRNVINIVIHEVIAFFQTLQKYKQRWPKNLTLSCSVL